MGQATDAYIEALSLAPEWKKRIRMTVSCTDCATIPKVPYAGEVITDGDTRYQLMHNGIKVLEDCYYGSWNTEIVRLLHGHHEPQEEKVFHALLDYIPDGGTMLELGSYWGYYSLWFHHRVRNAVNYLVEPEPNNLAVGRRNFELNNAQGHFYQYVVGRSSSESRCFDCHDGDRQSRVLPQTSVDDFLDHTGINTVEVLLADIQGAEYDMLQGAQRAIQAGRIRFLVISTHHHSISGDPLTHFKCLQFLKDQNAHLIAAHSVSESYSGDGLIVASCHRDDCRIPPVATSKNVAANSLFGDLEHDLHATQQQLNAARQQVAGLSQNVADLSNEVAQLRRLPTAVRHIGAVLRRLRRGA